MVLLHRLGKRGGALALLLALTLLPLGTRSVHADEGLTVFAAASLKNALDAANAAWTKRHGGSIAVSYAASGALSRQIENGAPADVFLSADLDWMDYLAHKGMLVDSTRRNLLGNALVLIAKTGETKPVTIDSTLDLGSLIGPGRLAVGAPRTVPAGKYAEAALRSLGLWQAVEAKLAPAESVRAALALVSRGEAPYGIVYRTDASADGSVAVVGTFPDTSHPPIVYPAAVLAGSRSNEAAAYLSFLGSAEARPFFEAEGFTILP